MASMIIAMERSMRRGELSMPDVESCDPFDNDCDGDIDGSNQAGSVTSVCGTALTNACEVGHSST